MSQKGKNKAVITEGLVFLDSQLATQDEVIQFIVEEALAEGYIDNQFALKEAVQQREREIPTAIGYQIAMPHGKTTAVLHPFIALVRTAEDFLWSEQNEDRVRLVFLIGVPEESEGKLHLKFISQLSKKLLDDDFRHRLLTETNQHKIFEQLSAIDI